MTSANRRKAAREYSRTAFHAILSLAGDKLIIFCPFCFRQVPDGAPARTARKKFTECKAVRIIGMLSRNTITLSIFRGADHHAGIGFFSSNEFHALSSSADFHADLTKLNTIHHALEGILHMVQVINRINGRLDIEEFHTRDHLLHHLGAGNTHSL